ncbi:ankyrin repeat domain-containing protein [Fretibacterium sp. OH1220_COT-178]|uniref:ankyrin repeat domain-containing protein n=1 Tax=Fretibacterium sp. OH1220_COT-178 TaxID=2491047 RepID=UPI000F5E01D7|nr:ankyrin repeat domain-containing protein [Fretibacterium sp. OH1220_COT-178]RRD66237.1 ankyrin repeat domain-containing protein [Fretibacterium sp. OH1220_COT-178]
MSAVTLHFENVQARIVRARELSETRDLLAELLAMSDSRLLTLFGVTRYSPQDVHGLKDQVFTGVVAELVRNGWNCDSASFGLARRDTFLMEMARRGLSRTVTRLLEMGADADYNTQGYGDSTVLMSARDPEIMKKLLYYGANPMAVNAHRQTDFSYKLLKGFVAGARFYLYNTEKIPFQKLLDNFRDCILSRESTPYSPMYPLCLVPVVPPMVPYQNIVDQALVDAMFDEGFFPFSSGALTFRLENEISVWQHLRFRMRNARFVTPSLLLAYLACMTKGESFCTTTDFACVDAYLEQPLPREVHPRGVFSKSVFVYMLFSLAKLPAPQLLRWLLLLGKAIRRVALWMDILGEDAFRVVNSAAPLDRKGSHVLQELTVIQSLLSLRVNVTDSFGEFVIPEELTTLLASGPTDSLAG